ncbi:MAG: hypothetical protein FWD97_00935 [Defluviitaleaceae bacterium]|nr:hypothetical protein [Defluviitaleaceae bacterium]
MFFKKNKKTLGRVVCPIPIILQIIQDAIDTNEGSAEFDIRLNGKDYAVGFTSDFNRTRGFFDPEFYFDDQKFTTFEDFKAQALLDGQLFAQMTDSVEVFDVDRGQKLVKFPWYTKFDAYVVE